MYKTYTLLNSQWLSIASTGDQAVLSKRARYRSSEWEGRRAGAGDPQEGCEIVLTMSCEGRGSRTGEVSFC